ncbi:hypothetical protein [Ferrimonas balearica]|uniref:hypothetical protein n=1 Tax=Ferrimonas balearica TaxID=44012 RepID=UPI001C99ACEF|nr:hypothetical protein [Ferrimonas balearica]MBY5991853.1 hypothetical protein [Ferrimonas balearica]
MNRLKGLWPMMLVLFAGAAQATDCSEIQWHQDVLAAYPGAAKACQAVVEIDGEERVEIVADFVRAHPGNKITVDIHQVDGTKERLTVKVDKDVKVNDQVELEVLPRGYEMTIYVPQDRFEVAKARSDVEYVVEEVVVAEVAYLPDTASDWYLLGALGAFMLALGSALGIWRHTRA